MSSVGTPIRQSAKLVQERSAVIPDRKRIVAGIRNFAALTDSLAKLRAEFGLQDDFSMDIHHILSLNDRLKRKPILVLAMDSTGKLESATLFFERCVFGLPTGILRAGDHAGDGAIIARSETRISAFCAAVELLVRSRRYHTVFGTVPIVSRCDVERQVQLNPDVATFRTVQRRLRLAGTYDELLKRFRRKMRHNVRSRRTQFDERYDAEYFAELAPDKAREAMDYITQASFPRRTNWEIEQRIQFLRKHPQAFAAGLQLRTGEWLSLVSGWRAGGVTYVSLAMHNRRYAKDSLVMVINSYLLEGEIFRKQQWIQWIGGVSEKWSTECEPEECLCLTRSRPCLVRSTLQWLAARFKLNTAFEFYEDELSQMGETSPQEKETAATQSPMQPVAGLQSSGYAKGGEQC